MFNYTSLFTSNCTSCFIIQYCYIETRCERSIRTRGLPMSMLKIDTNSFQRGRSGEFTHFFPNLASSNNIQFQELAILPGGEILYNTDRIDTVAQADGPGNEIKELETTKESRERDEKEIRGYDFFLSLTRSVFTTGAGKTASTTHLITIIGENKMKQNEKTNELLVNEVLEEPLIFELGGQ